MAVRIIVDSACDLIPEQIKKYQLDVLPIKTIFGEEEFLDGVTMSHEEFFEKLVESEELPTTSQVTPIVYEEKYEEVKQAGDTAVVITLSSKLSGCYQSANIALDGYEDIITVVDSNNVCIGQQILTMLAVQLRDAGKGAKEIAEELGMELNTVRTRIRRAKDLIERMKDEQDA